MKFFTSLFAAAAFAAAPAQAVPQYHSIVNPDGSAFTCKFNTSETRCYKSSARTRHKALNATLACSAERKAKGIHPTDLAWHRECMNNALSSMDY